MKYLIIALMLLASCSSEEEVSMANSNGIITAPVRVEDVQQVLGVSSGDVGYLCSNQHGKINKWSLKKPVDINAIVIDRATEWWKGDAKDCNLEQTRTTSSTVANWVYRNVEGFPYRLHDFEGYCHAAVEGLAFKTKSVAYNLVDDYSTRKGVDVYVQDDANSVTLYDMRESEYVKDYNLGIIATTTELTANISFMYLVEINKRSLSVNIPYADLSKLGVGSHRIQAALFPKTGETEARYQRAIFETYYIPLVISGVNITVSSWGNVQSPADGKLHPFSDFPYYGSSYLDVTGSNFYVGTLGFSNKSSMAISNENVYMYFRWENGSNIYYKRVRLMVLSSYSDTNPRTWKYSAGESGGSNFGCLAAEIPKITNSSGGATTVYVALQVNYNNTSQFMNLTDLMPIRMRKTDGTVTPDLVQ